MAAESAASDAGDAFDRPQSTLPSVGDDDHGDLITGHTLHDFPNPVDHGFGTQIVLNDLDDGPHDESAYKRTWRGWQNLDIEPEEEPAVLVEDVHTVFDWLHDEYPAHLVLKSKRWMVGTSVDPDLADRDAGSKALNGQRFEYSIQVMRYDEDSGKLADDLDDNLRCPISFQCWIQPQDTDLVRPSGDPMVCQHEEGTKYKTQTTYANARESLTRTIAVMNMAYAALGQPRPAWETLNRDSWKVWKGEVHHRFDDRNDQMKSVVHRLGEAKTLLQYGGGGDVDTDGTMRNGRHVEEMVVSDRWEKLGFRGRGVEADLRLGVKVYRINGNPSDQRLKYPKLEAFIAGSDGELPHADQWDAIRSTLRQLVNTFATMGGLNLGELREDDIYKPRDREMLDFYYPEGWRFAVQEANEARLHKMMDVVRSAQTPSKLDVLWTVADRCGASYEEIAGASGLSEDRVQEIVAEFVERDVLLRVSMPRIIVFDNEELRLSVMDELAAYYPEDTDMRAIQERADQRREARERRRERRAEEDDQDAGDASSGDGDGDGGDRADGDTDTEEPGDWMRVDLLDYSREDVGRYIEKGDIPAENVKVRVTAHDWLLIDR